MCKAGGLGGQAGRGREALWNLFTQLPLSLPYTTEEVLALSLLRRWLLSPLNPVKPWDGAPLCCDDKWVHSQGELDIPRGCVGGQGSVRHTKNNRQLCRLRDQ